MPSIIGHDNTVKYSAYGALVIEATVRNCLIIHDNLDMEQAVLGSSCALIPGYSLE